MPNHRPIAYFSKALSERTLAKSAYEREIMALALAMQHKRPYLLGRKFTVFSNQKSLGYLLHQRISTLDQKEWVVKLLGNHFDISYKPGKENKVADALSIRESAAFSPLISLPTWEEGYHLLQETNNDPMLQKIKAAVSNDPLSRLGFTLQNGVLYHKG